MNLLWDKFAIRFELIWKVLKELLACEGIEAIRTGSSCESIKSANQYYPPASRKMYGWICYPNNMAHIYNGNAANALAQEIIDRFIELEHSIFTRYGSILERLYGRKQHGS